MLSDKQAEVIGAFKTTSKYLDDYLNIINAYFDNMVRQIYPSELKLNKASTSDTEAAFLDLHLSVISNDVVSKKITLFIHLFTFVINKRKNKGPLIWNTFVKLFHE